LDLSLTEQFCAPSAGNVHRAQEIQTGVGGKGQDVAIALSCLAYPDFKLAQFIGSGVSGDQVCAMLRDRLGDDAAVDLTVRPKSELRTCTSIIANDETTELVEPSGVNTSEEMEEFMARLQTHRGESGPAAALCFMGSMPPGCGINTYAEIYRIIADTSTICLVDSVVGLEPLLDVMATAGAKKALLKVNASELCHLTGTSKTTCETGGITERELLGAFEGLLRRLPSASTLSAVCVTDGRHPAYLCLTKNDDRRIHSISPPALPTDKKLFPIGAGDAVAAGTLAALAHIEQRVVWKGGDALMERASSVIPELAAFAFGLACGSASCLQPENSVLDTTDAFELFKEIMSTAHQLR